MEVSVDYYCIVDVLIECMIGEAAGYRPSSWLAHGVNPNFQLIFVLSFLWSCGGVVVHSLLAVFSFRMIMLQVGPEKNFLVARITTCFQRNYCCRNCKVWKNVCRR